MLSTRIRPKLTYANVMSTIAVFGVLAGGGAYAASKIGASDIANDAVRGKHIKANAVRASEIKTDAVRAAEVAESELDQVPSALLGGFGRSAGNGICDPVDLAFVACATVALDLPDPARVLLIGQGTANGAGDLGGGDCRIGSTSGAFTNTRNFTLNPGQSESFTIVVVSDVFAAGQHSFWVECNQGLDADWNIHFDEVDLAAVAISPS